MSTKFWKNLEDRLDLIVTILIIFALGAIVGHHFDPTWPTVLLAISFGAWLITTTVNALTETSGRNQQPPNKNSSEK